jgi:hypothetical protein
MERRYELDPREDEARFVREEYACDICAGVYRVAGVVSPRRDGRRSYPLPICGLEARGGWPCSCADVSAAARVKP